MEASTFIVTERGYSAQDAFNRAVTDAQHEYGHGGYTGTIAEKNCFTVIQCPRGTDPRIYAHKLIDDDDRRISDKWGPAGCIVLEEGRESTIIPTKVKTENFVHKGTREWKSWYIIYDESGKEIGKSLYKDEAVNKAKDYCLLRQVEVEVKLEKRLEGSSSLVAKISPVPVKSNAVLGKYLFFGWASD